MRKPKNPELAIIERVMAEPLPAQGDLTNPFKKSGGTRQFSLKDVQKAEQFPEDFDRWSLKLLADYFAYKYREDTGGNYVVTYNADCPSFQRYCKEFASQGLGQYQWCKIFIDWGIKNRLMVVKRHKHLTVQTLGHVLNEFLQEEVMPLVEEEKIERTADPIEPFVETLDEALLAVRRLEFFAQFGIPVAATYLVNIRHMAADELLDGLIKAIDGIISTLEGKSMVERIVVNSIASAPYPKEGFVGLDWRIKFPALKEKFGAQKWWRDEDFKGVPLKKYRGLLA
jgi:hypothetical protein